MPQRPRRKPNIWKTSAITATASPAIGMSARISSLGDKHPARRRYRASAVAASWPASPFRERIGFQWADELG
jgi:hypothetical protein